MDFKIGFDKRPKRVEADTSKVIFEQETREGLIEVEANQTECEAYGFEFRDNACKLKLRHSKEPGANKGRQYLQKRDIFTKGSNTIPVTSRNNIVSGVKNVIRDGNNNLINGEYNLISENIYHIERPLNNCNISGYGGNATIPNHYVHGGNSVSDITGERQYTRVIFGTTTTAGGTVNSFINNDGEHFYPIPKNSIMYFNASCIAVRTDVPADDEEGSSIGDYAAWLERGVVINKNGTCSLKRTRKSMSNDGNISNWRPTASITDDKFRITVRGASGMTVEWTCVVDFTEFRASVNLDGS